MKLPWHNQTRLAKWAAILATILLVAVGLCGANFVAVAKFVPLAGPAPATPSPLPDWAGGVLIVAAFVEAAVIILSTLGLILIVIFTIARILKKHFS